SVVSCRSAGQKSQVLHGITSQGDALSDLAFAALSIMLSEGTFFPGGQASRKLQRQRRR
ncbi:hypothetical protein DIPPA_35767, partial [Diplonema papillatum]